MSERMTNILGYLTLAAILAAIWILFGEDPSREQGARGERTFAGLAERVNETARITLANGGEQLVLTRADDSWRVENRSGYSANTDKVRSLLRGFARSERREPKTANPERFDTLELGDAATTVILADETGGTLLNVRIGKRKEGGSGRSLTFIFQETDTRAWLVSGIEDVPVDATEWLATDLLGLAEQRIRSVTLNDVTLSRPLGGAGYSVAGLADGETAVASYKLAEPARTLAGLDLADVEQTANPLMEPTGTGELLTHDGLRVRFTLFEQSDATWVQLEADYDAARASEGEAGELPQAPADGQAEEAELNAKLRGWLFKLSSFDADILKQNRADFVETDAAEAAAS